MYVIKPINIVIGVMVVIPGTVLPAARNTEAKVEAASLVHLSRPGIKKQVKESWGASVAKHQAVVRPYLVREQAHGGDHIPMYHGDPFVLVVYQKILKHLYTYEFGKTARDDYIFMRWWHNKSSYNNVQEFCDANPMELGPGKHNDSKPIIGAQVMSVNPTIFNNAHRPMESSWEYYLKNHSCWISRDELLDIVFKDIFTFYKFNEKYLKALKDVAKKYEPAEGSSLVQILIPTRDVDKYVYLVGPDKLWGIPRDTVYKDREGNPIAPQDFDPIKKRYVRCSGVLRYRLERPHTLKDITLDGIQARLLMNDDVVHPDKNTFKMLRVSSLGKEKIDALDKELDELFKAMVADKKDTGTPIRSAL